MANKKNDSWNDKKQTDKQPQSSPNASQDKSKKAGPCKNSLPT